ncbi:hypothetical protein NDU88_001712 [Pleurodeles waltl]|uniref:Uncharacterized protein n=1 Tax=Pleurodeles waltl TaxID=8319 RepID=A0AAV7MVE5_PLEWA|nr:hypothetical protein NDU88_001712 [Pleurodeles waltl]
MCAPQFLRPEERRRAAGAALWCRAALELRQTRRGAARIHLWGNSGSSYISGSISEAKKKARQGALPNGISEKGTRQRTAHRIIIIMLISAIIGNPNVKVAGKLRIVVRSS